MKAKNTIHNLPWVIVLSLFLFLAFVSASAFSNWSRQATLQNKTTIESTQAQTTTTSQAPEQSLEEPIEQDQNLYQEKVTEVIGDKLNAQ